MNYMKTHCLWKVSKKKPLKQVCHYEILFNMKKLDFINLLENTIGKSAV